MNKNILIVDDERHFGNLLVGLLQKEGYAAVYVANGEEALQILQVKNFDLVLTDLHMPEKDGFELIARIKTTYPSLKFIVMSGGSAHASAFPGLKIAKLLGAVSIIAKPFSKDELLIALNHVFN